MNFAFLNFFKKLKLTKFFIFFGRKEFRKDRIKPISNEQYLESMNFLNEIDPFILNSSFEKTTNCSFNAEKYDLDIIVPVYNVERFISDCITSIVKQNTSYKIRVIVVDDGSCDNSVGLATKILETSNKEFLIVSQSNQGLAAARNKGLEYVDAKYLMFVDSDDILANNCVEKLLNVAFKNDCDCVQGQFINFENHLTNNDKVKKVLNSSANVLYGFAWGKIYKSHLWKSIRFPVGLWYEDTIIKFFLELFIKNFVSINDIVYYYRKNKKGISFSARGNLKSIDTVWALLYCFKLLENNSISLNIIHQSDIVNHIMLSTVRTSYLNKDVNRAIFNIWRKLVLDMNCQTNYALNKKMSLIIKNILLNRFYRFEVCCF